MSRSGGSVIESAESLTGALSGAYNSAFDPNRDGKPRWGDLFAAGEALLTEFRDADALIAAVDDALDATTKPSGEDALAAVAWSLAELRAIAELQRGPWRRTQLTIEQYLTVLDKRGDLTSQGRFAVGTDRAAILDGLHAALRTAPPVREYGVWIATLAGPSPRLTHPRRL